MRDNRRQLITILAVRLSGLEEAAKVGVVDEAQVRSTWEGYFRALVSAVNQGGSIAAVDPIVVAFGLDDRRRSHEP